MTSSWNESKFGPEKKLPAWYASAIKERSSFPIYEHLAAEGFPTVTQLRNGIVLGSIAHALWLAANEGCFARDQYWKGNMFVNDDGQGEQWAVSFTPTGAVAVFYSNESDRNPFPDSSPPYEQSKYFRGIPDSLLAAKEQALSQFINLEWEMGGENAVVTAAMWADGNQFTANEPWKDVLHHSQWGCYMQLLPLDVALFEWQNEYDLSDENISVLSSLYRRRIASTATMIKVQPDERMAFIGAAEGMNAAIESLSSVGITLTIDG